jgi:hypothetical protein
MGWGKNKVAVSGSAPTRITWSVQMTGRCCGGHECSTTMQVSRAAGSVGRVTGSGQCSVCYSDVDLVGYIG